MNPKISNCGLTSMFMVNQTQRNKIKAIKTHGYMSSKYSLDGLLSMKSNVFSFGVLLLEIITGKKTVLCPCNQLKLKILLAMLGNIGGRAEH
ncbi:PREDICTED: putative receptor-like protein kinase At4g00960 [Ipomoea nil]|uniref:putative receptor-like protein kinase At4g00960 n=1 Tax=Ipomoea nil TaxID=35883 RepID=UPI000901BD00|nr:PREDICTED: putative receptor-like protein kinase At4g00960 [Ipomoea nil]